MNRKRAERSLAEVFRFDSESMIEAGAIVFPCDGGGEFDHLGFAEVLAESSKQLVANLDWSAGHAVGIFQGQLFEDGKV